jgi:hypothetical protein
MTELHPDLKLQKIIEEAKTNKVEHAKVWVEDCLREADGPWDRSSAVVVITALPIKDDKGNFTGAANINQALLPDMDFSVLADALEGLAAKVRQHIEDTSERTKREERPN